MGMWVLGTVILAYLHCVSGVSSPPVQANTPVSSLHKVRSLEDFSGWFQRHGLLWASLLELLMIFLKVPAAMQGNDDHFVAVDDGNFVVGCETFYPALYNQ